MAFYQCVKVGGGGTGDVADVEVNGVSVLDPDDKIAKITSYEEVTESEYEAIPVTERENNGIAYFIKDLNNESVQGYPPLIYSDEEREIGVWRDGKPLYQKTIDIAPLPNRTTKEIQLDADIERVISMHGYGIDANDKWDVFLNDVVPTNVTGSVRVFFNTTTKKLYINTGENLTSYTEAYVTIQYTKTTDTAGSGIWNGQGGIAHHYSTNETVIGTWIDGKPLYERTKVVPFANFRHNNDTYFTPIISDNTETLRNVEAIAYSTGYGVCTLGSRAYSRDNTLSYYWELVEYYSNVALHFIGESATDVGVTEVIITYQYTKTTD